MIKNQSNFKQAMAWLGIVCCVVLLSFCSTKPQDEIVGRWKEADGTETMEFRKDGTVTIEDEGQSMAGNYKIADNGQIKLEIVSVDAHAVPILSEGSLSDAKLNFTLPSGKVTKYSKIK